MSSKMSCAYCHMNAVWHEDVDASEWALCLQDVLRRETLDDLRGAQMPGTSWCPYWEGFVLERKPTS